MFQKTKIYTFAILLCLTACLTASGSKPLYLTNSLFTSEDHKITIEVTEKVNASTSNSKNGKISIKVSGGNGSYEIKYYGPGTASESKKTDEMTIKNIIAGKYLFIAKDTDGNITHKVIMIEVDK